MATASRATKLKIPTSRAKAARMGRPRASSSRNGSSRVGAPAPHEPGRFGVYGGRYVPETLMAALEELEREYEKAKKNPQFRARLDGLLKTYAGRPTPLSFARRLTQNQQLPRPGVTGRTHGQASGRCRNRRGPAWRSDGNCLRSAWLRVCRVH